MTLDFANKPSFSGYLFHALILLRSVGTREYLKALVLNLPLLIVGLFFLLEGLADIFVFRENLRLAAGNFLNFFLLALLPLSLAALPFYHRNLIIAIGRKLNYRYLKVPDENQYWSERIIFLFKYYFLYLITHTVSVLAFLLTILLSAGFAYILIGILALISMASQNYAGILLSLMLYGFGVVMAYALSFSFPAFLAHAVSLKRPAYFTDSLSFASRYFFLLFPFYTMEAFFKIYGFILISIAGLIAFNVRMDFFSTEVLKTTAVLTELTPGQQSIIGGAVVILAAALNVFWDVLKNIYLTLIWYHHSIAAEGIHVQILIDRANSESV